MRRSFFFQDGDLFLDLFADAGTMRFSAAEMMEEDIAGEEEAEVEEEVVEEETVETTPETESEPVRGLW